MVLLVVGLAGFGIGVGGGLTTQDVARVGDQKVTADQYGRAVDQQIRRISAQIDRNLTMSEARQYGIDRLALIQLVNDAALDGEAERIGLSVGDDAVRDELRQIPAFQGSDGFDRAAYLYSLERIGMNAGEFEEDIRRELARGLLATSAASAAAMPAAATDVILEYVGETRSFGWIALDESMLDTSIPEPDEAALTAFHDAHAETYTRPETQKITYAIASPERIAANIEVPEDELRAAYDSGKARFTTPERRLLDRIGFRTDADAAEAKSRIDAGTATFDEIAEERGLSAADTDQGLVEASALPADAREAVFGPAEPGIVGPVPSPLGPSLYRINAILAAQVTPFEDARETLRQERAQAEAQRQIHDDLTHIEDLIAGGATLEEIADETVMHLDKMDYTEISTDPVATDPAFGKALQDAREGEETDLVELADGSYLSLRVDAVEPPAVIPLDEIRDQIAADWRSAELTAALGQKASALQDEIAGGRSLSDIATELGTELHDAGPMARSDTLADTPPRLVAEIFAADADGTVVVDDVNRVILAQLTEIAPPDPTDERLANLRTSVSAQFAQQAHDDLRELYTTALRDEAGVRLNQSVIDSTLDRFQ